MKVSFLKLSRKKEVIKRLELSDLAEMIRENPEKDRVFNLRLNYQFYKPKRPAAYPLCSRMYQLQGDSERAEVQWSGGGRSQWSEDL